jgi:hypothetical protein
MVHLELAPQELALRQELAAARPGLHLPAVKVVPVQPRGSQAVVSPKPGLAQVQQRHRHGAGPSLVNCFSSAKAQLSVTRNSWIRTAFIRSVGQPKTAAQAFYALVW